MNRIGTCSNCGGPVVVPEYAVNPLAHCASCGAIPQSPHGPVIPMQPPPKPDMRDPKPHSIIYRGFNAQ